MQNQEAGLGLVSISNVLATKKPARGFETLEARNKYLISKIKKVGVTFTLNPEIEKELRKAGAGEDLIQAIRESNTKSSATPTPQASVSPAVLPSVTPTVTPDLSSTPSAEKTPTPVPTPTATPTPEPKRDNFKNALGLEMIYIPGGEFLMGSESGYPDEKPTHKVTIKEGFWIGKTELTQQQYEALMKANPSAAKSCKLCPVEQVTWDDAQEFLKKLNLKKDGYYYRLPTEAEWEYAARAGTTGKFAGSLDSMAWYANTSGRTYLDADDLFEQDKANYDKKIRENGGQTHEAGTKQPNAFGLYDMHGNVWEWVEDTYKLNYEGLSNDGTANISLGDTSRRIIRGGSWRNREFDCRSSNRGKLLANSYNDVTGFRVLAVSVKR